MFIGNQLDSAPDRNPAGRPAGWRRRRRWLALFGPLMLASGVAVGAEEVVAKEYQIKASFLYNFTKFVEWPRPRFVDESSPIVIGVLGRNPFGDELKKIVQGREVNGRSIVVKSIVTADDTRNVHLLFVPAGDEHGFELATAALMHAGVVTVGESGRFLALGGMINFTLEGDKVRFEIDIDSVERGDVKISSKLQVLARAIRRHP